MKKSLESSTPLNRKSILFLGIVLSLLASGVATWRVGAQSDAREYKQVEGVRSPSIAPETLYGISNGFSNPAGNLIYQINPANGNLTNIVQVTLPGFTIFNALALAARPSDGALFAVVQTTTGSAGVTTSRRLVRVNPATGVATDVGLMANQSIAALAFRSNGVLYGASGQRGNNPETLFTINTSTAALTVAFALGNGADGETIAFHPNGLLYHSSGNGTALFESVNVDTQVVTPIGSASGEAFAMGYSPNFGQLFLSDISSKLYTINIATGARTQVGNMSGQLGSFDNRGLAFVSPVQACNTYTSGTTAGQSIVPGTVDIGNHGDDTTTNIALPFPVNFYGNNFSSANVSSNGNLQFTGSNTQFSNESLPTVNMNNLIAPFWDDLRTDAAGGGIFTSVSGSAPNRIFNIEWRTIYFGTSTTVNFETRLYETGQIDFVYGNLNGTGSSATVGMQKGDGAGGAFNTNLFSFNTASLSNGMGITFSCGAGAVSVRVADTVVTVGDVDAVPVILTGLGGEKTVSFSLNYATNPFANNPTAVCGSSNPGCTVTVNNATPGQIGVTVTNAGTFNPGPREVAKVLFQTLPNGGLTNTPLTVGDVPTPRAVLLGSGGALPSTFTGGLVVFANGLEGDIAGRNTGNGTVDASDVTIERSFIVGSLTPDPTFNEPQRADVSPAVVKGDGQLDATDLVQVRRYAAQIDGPQSAGGFNGAPPPIFTAAPQAEKGAGGNRAMRVVSAVSSPGAKVTVPVELDTDGGEVAASFTLNFDAAKLGNPVVSLDGDGAVLTTNTSKAGNGKLGVLVDSASPLARQVVLVTFDVSATAQEGETVVSFSDALAKRSVSDADGNRLSTRYDNGTVTISGPASAGVAVSGRVLSPDGRGVRNAQVSITDQNGAVRTVTTSSFGYYQFDGVAAGGVYTLNVASRQFRFAARTILVSDNLTDVDLIGLD